MAATARIERRWKMEEDVARNAALAAALTRLAIWRTRSAGAAQHAVFRAHAWSHLPPARPLPAMFASVSRSAQALILVPTQIACSTLFKKWRTLSYSHLRAAASRR